MKGVSFSEEVKNELVNLQIENGDVEYEMAGFLKAKGGLVLESSGNYISVVLSSPFVARRLKKIISFEGSRSKILYTNQKILGRKQYKILISPNDLDDFLKRHGIDLNQLVELNLDFHDPERFGAFCRGLFLASGSVTDPKKSYHLEFFIKENTELFEKVRNHLYNIFGIKSRIIKNHNGARLYLKKGSDIVELLNSIGALRGAAYYQSIIEQRIIKSDVFRTINFISANANRTGQSSSQQIRAIELIQKTVGLDYLKSELRELAIARLQNSELSLRELGEILENKLPKSTVYNRMKKIIEIAKNIEKSEEK
ncbi:MAG TPA: DNA-binding protein WhiA [Thermotogaceae bacterium]|nr:DNA-binding protein WhiA [Thermotogaceae bacterium]